MRFRLSNEPLFWTVFILFILPLTFFTFIDKSFLSCGEKLSVRIVFCIFIYVAFVFYILQGGRMYV